MKKMRDFMNIPNGYEYESAFWRTSQYKDYDQASRDGGVYNGETTYGYTSFVDSMCNALAAATCLDADADNDLRVRVELDGRDLGDFKLSDAR
jgi:hypothetical protein